MTVSKGKHRRHRKGADVTPAGSSTLDTAGGVALRYIKREVDTLMALDPLVRLGNEAAVHRTRVAARRIRSALATFGPLFERSQTRPVREELQWLGGVLAPARDNDVLRERLLGRARELPSELVLGPVVARIQSELGQRAADAAEDATAGLGSDRHAALLAALNTLTNAPKLTRVAAEPPAGVCLAQVRAAGKRVGKAAAAAEAAEPGHVRHEALHDVRKAAKRARYAAEATAKVLGPGARVLTRRMADLQTVLGDHLDSTPAQEALRAMGVRAHLAGENGFTFGLLLGLEHAAAQERLAAYPGALDEALAALADLAIGS